ncbi:substrate-binding domain-containing protein [Oceanicella sp. SM1341]|uniref:substrate-binding domain-containing protein n=1 Tax=Oceanicella sp. SM1341 TaxID=1548889 RepID=UPI000E4E87CB|nr:substrate-binding domain-containing protein [Oceanicella sp. SM1341]
MRAGHIARLRAAGIARLRAGGVALAALLGLCAGPLAAQTSDLTSESAFRVCADPAAYPFSDREETGYENRIAALFAEKLGLPLEYYWFPMATGFIRKTLGEDRCDVVMGYAQGHELVLNTNHYLTSAYVIVTRTDSPLSAVDTLSDPALKSARIGTVAGTPPASHLARNGLMGQVEGYQLMVDSRHDSPSAQMIADLEAGRIDAALLWGPIGGALAHDAQVPLTVTPLIKETLPPRLFYRITMGVRQGEMVWKRELNSLIRRNQAQIDAILAEYGVPMLNDNGTALKDIP